MELSEEQLVESLIKQLKMTMASLFAKSRTFVQTNTWEDGQIQYGLDLKKLLQMTWRPTEDQQNF